MVGFAGLRAALASVAMVGSLLAGSAAALANATIVVPFPAGSSTDTMVRMFSDKLEQRLGERVLVENRPGGSGMVAINDLKAGPANGSKFMLMSSSQVLVGSFPDAQFDVLNDFEPVFIWCEGAYMFASNTKSGFRSLQDVLAASRERRLRMAVNGNGTATHVTALLFLAATGADIVLIPYKGSSETALALLSGEIDVTIDGFTALKPQIEAGNFTQLAVTSAERFELLPDLPGMKESGVDDVDIRFWIGLVAQKGTDKAVVDKWNAALSEIFGDPDFARLYVERTGTAVVGGTPESMAERMASDKAIWTSVIEREGITIN